MKRERWLTVRDAFRSQLVQLWQLRGCPKYYEFAKWLGISKTTTEALLNARYESPDTLRKLLTNSGYPHAAVDPKLPGASQGLGPDSDFDRAAARFLQLEGLIAFVSGVANESPYARTLSGLGPCQARLRGIDPLLIESIGFPTLIYDREEVKVAADNDSAVESPATPSRQTIYIVKVAACNDLAVEFYNVKARSDLINKTPSFLTSLIADKLDNRVKWCAQELLRIAEADKGVLASKTPIPMRFDSGMAPLKHRCWFITSKPIRLSGELVGYLSLYTPG